MSAAHVRSHTPGPWYAVLHKSGAWEIMAGEQYIAAVCEMRGATQLNARVIAAAPELLEQCRSAVEHIDLLRDTINTLAELGATVAICGATYDDVKARAAIAKAEGSHEAD